MNNIQQLQTNTQNLLWYIEWLELNKEFKEKIIDQVENEVNRIISSGIYEPSLYFNK